MIVNVLLAECLGQIYTVKFVVTIVTVEITVSWNVPCSLVEVYRIHEISCTLVVEIAGYSEIADYIMSHPSRQHSASIRCCLQDGFYFLYLP